MLIITRRPGEVIWNAVRGENRAAADSAPADLPVPSDRDA
jgi:hypothetical protein